MRRAGNGNLLKAEEEGPRSSSIIATPRFGTKDYSTANRMKLYVQITMMSTRANT